MAGAGVNVKSLDTEDTEDTEENYMMKTAISKNLSDGLTPKA